MENGGSLTKSDLKAALTVFRGELKADLADSRAELKADLTDLRGELKADLADLRNETKADLNVAVIDLRNELTETMRQIETNLLTEFHRYGKGQQLRLHTTESRDAIITERLAIIEERRPPTV
jgi:ribosomal protein L29